MNRFLFLANLMQVAWASITNRAQAQGRDADAVRNAFDWGQLVREVLFARIDRTQAMWEQRMSALIKEAEDKVPKIIMPNAPKPSEPPEAVH